MLQAMLPTMMVTRQGDHIYTTSQVVNATVGVYELVDEVLEFSIGPNPTESLLNISYTLQRSANISMKIFDAKGSIVKSVAMGNKAGGITKDSFDLAELPTGMYMIQLLLDNNISTTKVFQKI